MGKRTTAPKAKDRIKVLQDQPASGHTPMLETKMMSMPWSKSHLRRGQKRTHMVAPNQPPRFPSIRSPLLPCIPWELPGLPHTVIAAAMLGSNPHTATACPPGWWTRLRAAYQILPPNSDSSPQTSKHSEKSLCQDHGQSNMRRQRFARVAKPKWDRS